MYRFIYNLLTKIGLNLYVDFVTYLIIGIIVLIICITIRALVKYFLVRISERVVKKTKFIWDDILFENKLFHRMSNIVIPITISIVESSLPDRNSFMVKAANVATTIVAILLLDSLINSIDQFYLLHEISKIRPIRGFIQVVKAAIILVSIIIIIAIFVGQSPMALLGGLGAMTAVTSFIFKDAILGFVAGIQLTANDMIRIGDWVEVPNYLANGTVIDLSMTTIKVQNFDKSITSIPAYTLVSDAFINWRGMENAGGRRIRRAIYIDATDVKFCDDEMLGRLSKINLLKDYLSKKLSEFKQYNEENNIDPHDTINGKKITNIGLLRIYIIEYLKNHPRVHKELAMMARQINTSDGGLALEIFAFSDSTVWADYEAIQSDIFEHLYAIISEFGLRIYQKPSGNDIKHATRG